MSTANDYLTVAGIGVDVVYKDIKNLHIGVYPPMGRVRVAAPERLDGEVIRLAVVQRLPWIKKQRDQLRRADRQSAREMVDGESHYAWGRRYRLRVVEDGARRKVTFKGGTRLELHVPAGAGLDARRRRLTAWYREELKARVPKIIEKWAPIVDVAAPTWGVKRMKTKWGTCNVEQRRIWVNLELVKKSPNCLEYIVVHEIVHLLERNHTDRFAELMDQFMPSWRTVRDELNGSTLADEEWQVGDAAVHTNKGKSV